MFQNEPVFYGIQEDGRYKLYQYFPVTGMNTQMLILAQNIREKKDAKLMVELLNKNIEKEE